MISSYSDFHLDMSTLPEPIKTCSHLIINFAEIASLPLFVSVSFPFALRKKAFEFPDHQYHRVLRRKEENYVYDCI